MTGMLTNYANFVSLLYAQLFRSFFKNKSFYRATPCWRGICRSRVCLSQVGVLLKRLNVGSRKQRHTITQGL